MESNLLLLLLLGEVEPLKDGEHLLHPLVGVPEADGWDPGTVVTENPLFHFPEQSHSLLRALLQGRDKNEESENLLELIVCEPSGERASPNTSLKSYQRIKISSVCNCVLCEEWKM